MHSDMMTDAGQHDEHTSVLIVGGGLVGLTAGLFLQHHGVPFILIEQQAAPSILPRSRGIHVRSMELFRQLGLEAEVQAAAAAAWKIGSFGGARRGPSLLEAQPVTQPGARPNMSAVPSPSVFGACPQTTLEAVLRRPLVERGGTVRFGHPLVSFTQDAQGVTATVRDADGHAAQLRARYLIGADGGRSLVRTQLGVSSQTTPAGQHYVNIFFAADLSDRMQGRTFSQCEIVGDQVQGLMLSKDNATEWSFHLKYDPAVTDPATFTPDDLTGLVRAAIGDPGLPVRVIATTTWSTAVRIAEHYRVGRAFLVGDAAHVMPPWGGLGGNTGIADAHNLSWKLADVLAGRAADPLLDSYETERRPVAVRHGRQALLRTDFEARFDIETTTNQEVFRQLQDISTLLMKYPYPPADTAPPEQLDRPVERLSAQLGTRFPHAWMVRGGERISTLDLFGRAPVLLAGPSAPGAWAQDHPGAAPTALTAHVLQVGRDVELDPETDWRGLTGLPDDGAVLVRPDGIVAARSDGSLRALG